MEKQRGDGIGRKLFALAAACVGEEAESVNAVALQRDHADARPTVFICSRKRTCFGARGFRPPAPGQPTHLQLREFRGAVKTYC